MGCHPSVQHLLDLDEALETLATVCSRDARLIELLYFGGLSETEAAAELRISKSTVERNHRTAKKWLKEWLSR